MWVLWIWRKRIIGLIGKLYGKCSEYMMNVSVDGVQLEHVSEFKYLVYVLDDHVQMKQSVVGR